MHYLLIRRRDSLQRETDTEAVLQVPVSRKNERSGEILREHRAV
jgi:hypothetical protein